MADEPTTTIAAAPQVQAVGTPQAQLTAEQMAAVEAEARSLQLDTTIPGGAYMVRGRLVDCEGNPIKDKGKS